MTNETLKRDRSDANRAPKFFTLKRRRWAYGVLVAVGAAAVTYELVTPEQSAAILAVGAALLGATGLAVANPTHD